MATYFDELNDICDQVNTDDLEGAAPAFLREEFRENQQDIDALEMLVSDIEEQISELKVRNSNIEKELEDQGVDLDEDDEEAAPDEGAKAEPAVAEPGGEEAETAATEVPA